MKLFLDRKIADKRIYPAIDIPNQEQEEKSCYLIKMILQKMNVLRRIIAPMGTMDAIEFINSKLKDTKNNTEFFNSMNKHLKDIIFISSKFMDLREKLR